MFKNFFLVSLYLITIVSLFFLIPQLKVEEKKVIDSADISLGSLCKDFNYFNINQYGPDDLDKINIQIPNSQNWYENFLKASITGNYINSEFKNYFNSKVEVYFNDGLNCTLDAEIRIHGDFKDHINVNKLISSLDVKLTSGNILNITKFKLLIPDTRGHENEIFTTSIMSELGFLSPRTFYSDISINSGNTHAYIFQEKITKEFLENNFYRESAIIETNEKYVWENDLDNKYIRKDLPSGSYPLEIGKINNKSWAVLNFNNFLISLDALDKYNMAINTTFSNREINNYLLGENFNEIYEFESALWSLRAKHAVENTHNRKFLYDKISENFIPIYYDGDSSILNTEGPEEIDYKFYTQYGTLITAANDLIEKRVDFSNLTLKLAERGVYWTDDEVQLYIDRFYQNLELLTHYSRSNYKNKEFPLLPNLLANRTETDAHLLFVDYGNKVFELCDQFIEDCIYIDEPDYKILLNDNLKVNGKNAYLFGINKKTYKEVLGIKDLDSIQQIDNFYIKKINEANVTTNMESKTINISLSTSSDRIVILGGELIKDWKFNIFNDSNFKIKDKDFISRNDRNLLTGCITFYGVKIENISINAENMVCEDSVNFIRSDGEINEIVIVSSKFDALDIDFSKLKINTITMSQSLNDCLDVSYGIYELKNVVVSNCEDKGVSIGEKTSIKIKDLKVSSSKTGIAVKDSSFAEVENFVGDNLWFCFQVYQKKQEFGPAYLKLYNQDCLGINKNYVQEGSIYEY